MKIQGPKKLGFLRVVNLCEPLFVTAPTRARERVLPKKVHKGSQTPETLTFLKASLAVFGNALTNLSPPVGRS